MWHAEVEKKRLVKRFWLGMLRPFLTQSYSASRKGPFSTGLVFDWTLLPRGGWCEGVLLCGSRKSVGSSVLRAFFASNACFARDEPSSRRVGGVGLSRKPPKLRLWRCTQPRAAKATAVVAVVGKMASMTRATAACCRVKHAAGERS